MKSKQEKNIFFCHFLFLFPCKTNQTKKNKSFCLESSFHFPFLLLSYSQIFLKIVKLNLRKFADNEKEEEMEIGFPTDVKHVAHIGMEGPSANTPSWVSGLLIFSSVILAFPLTSKQFTNIIYSGLVINLF